jgi:hypothetical protein
MAKIIVGSPSLTQLLPLYPGMGPAMLEQPVYYYPNGLKTALQGVIVVLLSMIALISITCFC